MDGLTPDADVKRWPFDMPSSFTAGYSGCTGWMLDAVSGMPRPSPAREQERGLV